jgi:hypothetical protein
MIGVMVPPVERWDHRHLNDETAGKNVTGVLAKTLS